MVITLCSGYIVRGEEIDQGENMLNQEQELILKNHQTLLQRKAEKINGKYSLTLFGGHEIPSSASLMPSTGNVKMLILPIEFPDVKIPDEYKNFEEKFLEQDSSTEQSYQKISGRHTEIDDNSMKINNFVSAPASANARIYVHETGHMLGLIDLYKGNILDDGHLDIMSSQGVYFNVYHRYLLDWINPVIVPYTENIQEIDLYAVEEDIDDGKKPRAIIFTQDETLLPSMEFYMIEYRKGGIDDYSPSLEQKGYPGIIIWHCNTMLDEQGYYKDGDSYLKTVNKSGTSPFKQADVYVSGDVFSDQSNPSSNFYNGSRSGAYMKVIETDEEKAVLQAGFKNPDLEPAPEVHISAPSPYKKYVKNGNQITFQIESTGGTEFNWDIVMEMTGDIYPDIFRTGSKETTTALVTFFQGDGTFALKVL